MPKKGYHDFPLKTSCLTVPKNLVAEPFGISENFGYRKILCIRGGYHDFLWEIFVSQYRKLSQRNPSVFQEISGIEKCSG